MSGWLDLQQMYRDGNLNRIASAEEEWAWRCEGANDVGQYDFEEYKYDADGRVINSCYQYDEKGHCKFDRYGNPRLLKYQYDEDGQMIKTWE